MTLLKDMWYVQMVLEPEAPPITSSPEVQQQGYHQHPLHTRQQLLTDGSTGSILTGVTSPQGNHALAPSTMPQHQVRGHGQHTRRTKALITNGT